MFKSSLLCAWMSVDQYVYMYINPYVCVCVRVLRDQQKNIDQCVFLLL